MAAIAQVRVTAEQLNWELAPADGPDCGTLPPSSSSQSGSSKADRHLASGLLYAPDGTELSGERFEALCFEEHRARRYYLAPRPERGGHAKRRVATNPLSFDTITTRPDHHLALRHLFAGGLDPRLIFGPFIEGWLVPEFRASSPYDLLAILVHLAEGNIHCHPLFATVTRDRRLLHVKADGRGRRGAQRIGPSHIGALRLANEGFIPEPSANFAREALKRSRATHGGNEPLDWRLSCAWDSYLKDLAHSPQYAPIFAATRTQYERRLAERRAESLPVQLEATQEERKRVAGHSIVGGTETV